MRKSAKEKVAKLPAGSNQYGAPTRERVTPNRVCELASQGCTNDEIAARLQCSADSLERRFAEALRLGRADLHIGLRASQVDLAMKSPHEVARGNMLMWLGKQYLGQRDQQEVRTTGEHAVVHAVLQLDDGELQRALQTARKRESLPPLAVEVLAAPAEPPGQAAMPQPGATAGWQSGWRECELSRAGCG